MAKSTSYLQSKFIHGDLDFSGKLVLDNNRDHGPHSEKLLDSTLFAETILIATLQRLVELDWAGVTFFYQPEDSSQEA